MRTKSTHAVNIQMMFMFVRHSCQYSGYCYRDALVFERIFMLLHKTIAETTKSSKKRKKTKIERWAITALVRLIKTLSKGKRKRHFFFCWHFKTHDLHICLGDDFWSTNIKSLIDFHLFFIISFRLNLFILTFSFHFWKSHFVDALWVLELHNFYVMMENLIIFDENSHFNGSQCNLTMEILLEREQKANYLSEGIIKILTWPLYALNTINFDCSEHGWHLGTPVSLSFIRNDEKQTPFEIEYSTYL